MCGGGGEGEGGGRRGGRGLGERLKSEVLLVLVIVPHEIALEVRKRGEV